MLLVVQEASRNWTRLIKNCKAVLNRFMIEFEDRLSMFNPGSYTVKFTASLMNQLYRDQVLSICIYVV